MYKYNKKLPERWAGEKEAQNIKRETERSVTKRKIKSVNFWDG